MFFQRMGAYFELTQNNQFNTSRQSKVSQWRGHTCPLDIQYLITVCLAFLVHKAPKMKLASCCSSADQLRGLQLISTSSYRKFAVHVRRQNPVYRTSGPNIRQNPVYRTSGPNIRQNPVYRTSCPTKKYTWENSCFLTIIYGAQSFRMLHNSMSSNITAALAYLDMCMLSYIAYNRGGMSSFFGISEFEQLIWISE